MACFIMDILHLAYITFLMCSFLRNSWLAHIFGFAVECASDPAASHFGGEGFRGSWVLVGRIGFTGESYSTAYP